MYRIGIDLGGTNIAVGIVDETQRIVGTAQIPTLPAEGAEAVLDRIAACAAQAAAAARVGLTDCAGAGLGAPGTCDMRLMSCVTTTVASWAGVNVESTARASFGPTPEMARRRSNRARSSRVEKP